ncbi:Polyketide cyclase/dehydrase [Macrophomina phaseolina MS6]|uniref:Polyketide cyclase/dehydrase n=1 Tax=Macrophomina phaseolina (strain MS6) TaxID=1126212 RepID=K2QXP8_MACPH|nr:Polyketide cyclase/dehydrase [Macrophomina phaseolina MS6]
MKALRIAPPRTLLHNHHRPTPPAHRLTRPQTRTFLPNPFAALSGASGSSSWTSNNTSSSASPTAPQRLTATRTLPYPSAAIYNIIADVSSYHTFLPYCQRSEITRWSRPDAAHGQRWPAEATLAVGWGTISEAFASRVYCVPGRLVEAVGGRTRTRLRPEEVPHHDLPAEGEEEALGRKGRDREILTHLLTRWALSPFPYQPPQKAGGGAAAVETPLGVRGATATAAGATVGGGATGGANFNPIDPQKPASGQPKEQTQVSLEIEFAFANPLYGTMMAAVTPMVANLMIEAFEKRVEQLLDGPGLGGTKQKVPGEGVLNYSGPLSKR